MLNVVVYALGSVLNETLRNIRCVCARRTYLILDAWVLIRLA